MTKTILSTTRTDAAASGTTTAGATQFWWFGYASTLPDSTEANREITYRAAGTVSKLYVRVISNGTSANSSVTLRKNGADTALTCTITAGTNGVFEDTSNSVSVAAGDKLCWESVSGGTGTLTFVIISAIYDSTTNCTVRYVTEGYAVTTASTTNYLPGCGNRSGTTGTESNTENTIKTAGTAKNFFVYVSGNSRTTNTTFTLRKNRVDTAIVITFGSGVTGILENTATTVSLAADDEFDWEITTLTGAGTLTFQCCAFDYETTTKGVLTRGSVGSTADISHTFNTTRYFALGGGAIEGVTTEADAQMTARDAFTFSNLIMYVLTNTMGGGTTTITLRVNGANSALTASLSANATGFFADTTHTVTVAAGDLINIAFTNNSVSGTCSLRQIGITAEAPSGQNITKSLATEALTLGESLGMVRGKARTVSQTLTLGESTTRLAAKSRAPSTQVLTLTDAAAKVKGVPRPISQTLTLGESLTLKRDKIRTRSETLTLGESATRQKAANRSIAQTLILSEAVTRIKGIPRSIAQTLTLGESLARKADKTRTVAQSLTLVESAVRKKSAFRSIAQTLSLGADTLTRIKGIPRSIAQTLTLGESLARAMSKTRSISQTLTLGENLTRLKAASRSIAQTLVLSDAVVKSRTVIRSIAQTLTLGESLTRMAAKTRAISQTLTLGESLTRLKSATRSLSQTLTVTDLAERFRGGVSRSISESLTVGDSVTRKADKTRSISQTLTLSEALNRSKGIIRAVPTQSLTLSDLVIRLRGRVRAISQILTLSESLTRQASKIRAISQTLTLSDNVTRRKGIIRSISETLTLSSQVTKLLAKIRSLSQTLTLGESLTRQASKIRTIAQTLTLTDNATQSKAGTQNIVRAVPTETLTIGDSVTRRKGIIKSIAENLTLGESLNRLAAKKRALATQVLAITDNVARIKIHGIVKTLADTLTVGDSVARRTAKIRVIAQNISVTDVLQGFKNGLELVRPVIEPPNLIGLRRVIVRKPRYTVRVKEITTIEQSATSNILIPAFKYQINRASSSIKIIEWLQKATARIALRLQLDQSVKASIKLAEQIKQTASASRIQIPPHFRQISKSKILNPKQQHKFAKLIRLFFMTDKID